MAPEDVKGKKRKGAADAAPKPKKQKKVDEAAAATKKSAKALNAAVKPIDDVQVNVKVSRKRAADLFDDSVTAQDKTAKDKKRTKKSKTTTEVKAGKDKDASVPENVAEVSEKPKKASKPSKVAKMTDAQKEKKIEGHSKKLKSFREQPEVENAEEDEEDDQTAALLAGFESDNDEDDPAEDVELDTEIKADIDPKTRTQLEKASKKKDEPGVIYVGRIPHGFYESQMRGYFKQFGKVTRLRVSRNKKTGAAKHYAFVEFASAEVADIVARTMNNYLMFGHILQCRVIPTAQINPKLFDGANTRFKIDPRNKKEGAQMEHGVERAVWEKRIANAQKKRADRNKMLKDEMDYEFTAPALRAVADVPKNVSTLEDGAGQQLLAEALAADVSDAVQAVESKPGQVTITEATVKVKARKPRKKAANKAADAKSEQNGADVNAGTKAVNDSVEATLEEAANAIAETQSKKSKKTKSKSSLQTGAEAVIQNVEAVAKAGADAVADAANTVINKVESVLDVGADEAIPEKNDAAAQIKPKKSRNRSKSKPSAADKAEVGLENGAEVVDPAKVIVDEVEVEEAPEKVESIKEKKGKGRKRSKSRAGAKADVEAINEPSEAATTASSETVAVDEPVKEKKKRERKAKTDLVPETNEEAPVQSIVDDVIDKAKTSTKKIKAAKKGKLSAA